ncbi:MULTISPECIES: hypothetical protein [Acinetobacter]|uniref:Uncharacterized protein n=1 Tax=Acinetobacter indicus TaxID=756892 RepID=A0A6C0Y698_9GAMM|nr:MULTISPECIES: hypothetical protein [Acinetobacter]QIC71771.1 hypothetical protein FSC09_15375 [Acinetobacter indicus]QKQ71679.1 hypothetical protein E5Y90_15735 [Acinetobacter sp. 10FS3-1]
MTNKTYEGFFEAHPYCNALRTVEIEETTVFTDHSKYALAVQVVRNHFHQYPKLSFSELFEHFANGIGQLSLLGEVIPFAYLTKPNKAYHGPDKFEPFNVLNKNVDKDYQPNTLTGSLFFLCTPDAEYPTEYFCIELVSVGDKSGETFYIDMKNGVARIRLHIGHNLPIRWAQTSTRFEGATAKHAVFNALLYQFQHIFQNSRSIEEIAKWIEDFKHIADHTGAEIGLNFYQELRHTLKNPLYGNLDSTIRNEHIVELFGSRFNFISSLVRPFPRAKEHTKNILLANFGIDYAHPELGFKHQFCPELNFSYNLTQFHQAEFSLNHCFSYALNQLENARKTSPECDIELWAIIYGESGTYAVRSSEFHILGMTIKSAIDELLLNKKDNIIVQSFIAQLPEFECKKINSSFDEYSQKFVEYFAAIECDLRVDYIAKGQVFFVSEIAKSQCNIELATKYAEQWGEMDLAF